MIAEDMAVLSPPDATSSASDRTKYSSDGIIMAAVCNRAGHYIFALWFLLLLLLLLLLSSFVLFFPRIISAVADCMSAILPHMVWP